MTPSHPRAVLFDLDGTLIDTAPEFVAIAHALRREAQLPAIPDSVIRHNISNGALGMVRAALELTHDDTRIEHWCDRFLTLYDAGLGQHSAPYPGLATLVSALAQKGIAWGVVTNKLERFAAPLMERMAFSPPADVLITPDHVVTPKPDPEAVRLACQRLACEPADAIFIGDHVRDIEAGNAAGCHTVAAAYGYLAQDESAADWGADDTVESSEALAALIAERIR